MYWEESCKVLRRSNDILSNMHGWFQRLWKSRVSLLTQREEEANATKTSASSVSSAFLSPSAATISQGTAPFEPLQPPSALSSQQRWSRKYDVLVCHSSVDSDTEEAGRLVSFLETAPSDLRCFIRHRDDSPGGAVSAELCEAVQNSHIWALLITPHFLHDEWCRYMMHQALAEGPMSHRIIPLVKNMSRSQVPQELKFFINVDLNINPHQGYALLNQTVLKYLEELVKKSKTLHCNSESSSKGLSGGS
ncbi:toll/interleukin-1 receptor domain-containing adapter protein [Notolabrus celidotus]|uniref:toll/interleukin-1 receptor domain-containing adapter protein n=1 Tax=Notolabrus celidotus TaxID=1203425 RepID=UPI00148F7573|nr:toll/interleukin-1 receptor domain-containing adapter protein [Notolabrus celidotus]